MKMSKETTERLKADANYLHGLATGPDWPAEPLTADEARYQVDSEETMFEKAPLY